MSRLGGQTVEAGDRRGSDMGPWWTVTLESIMEVGVVFLIIRILHAGVSEAWQVQLEYMAK